MQKKTEVLSPLGATIRQLLKRRKMKAYQLAEQVGISPTSISKIINGVTHPRQSTLTRMSQALCRDQAEQQQLLRAFTGAEPFDPAETTKPTTPTEKELQRLRAEQFLERRTQTIQFKRSVARELDKAGITYQQDYCQGPYSTDFLIEKDGQRIALECKANITQDVEQAIMIAVLLKNLIECQQMLVVVPYVDDELSRFQIDQVKVITTTQIFQIR